MVIEKIFLDEQDDKAELLVLGFENCVKNQLKNEDKIINYFDVISNLRMMDIKRLIFIYEFLEGMEPKNIFKADYRYHLRYVDEKLERLGLIKKPIVEADDADTDIQGTAVTNFGREILIFIDYQE